MGSKLSPLVFLILAGLLGLASNGSAQQANEKQHIELSMRMIGHQVLLNSGDSTSRVLPIQKEYDRYNIRFESDFQFNPDELVATIDSVVMATKMTGSYLVEVVTCETGEVVYSYKVDNSAGTDVIPCQTRLQPRDCYSLFITLYPAEEDPMVAMQATAPGPTKTSSFLGSVKNDLVILFLIVTLFFLIVLGVYYRRKRRNPGISSEIITIGEYQFDKRNMRLSLKDNKVELTGKEADLLFLLHSSANTTIERDVILKMVWGDDGDYIGRTLDVFISKLRKKLGADPSIKIANIRGVGYKLILNERG